MLFADTVDIGLFIKSSETVFNLIPPVNINLREVVVELVLVILESSMSLSLHRCHKFWLRWEGKSG